MEIYISKTKIICLYAGPGAGKSTTAAGLFHLMKIKHMSVELVTEFAKDVIWDNNYDLLKDQLFIFANQNRKLERLINKVEYIITDSPLLLTLIYMSDDYPKSFRLFVLDIIGRYHNINIFINRVKPYIQTGRVQTKEQAEEIDEKIKSILWSDRNYTIVDGDKNAPSKIFKKLFK